MAKYGSSIKDGLIISILGLYSYSNCVAEGGVVENIRINGAENISDNAILSVMKSKMGFVYEDDTLSQDEKNIRNLGFFKDVKVVGVKREDHSNEIVVQVTEFPLVRSYQVDGVTAFSKDEIEEIIGQYEVLGNVLNLTVLANLKREITEFYVKNHLLADVLIDLPREPKSSDELDLNIKVSEKKVGSIDLNGLSSTKPELIRKIIKTKENELFNYKTFDIDRRKLLETRWFETVEPKLSPDREDPNKINLSYHFKESHVMNLAAGAHFPSSSRILGTLSYGTTNLFGTGQQLNVSLSQDSKVTGFSGSLDYSNPYLGSNSDTLTMSLFSKVDPYSFSASYGNKSTGINDESFKIRKNGFVFGYLKNIFEDWSISARYKLEDQSNVKTDQIDVDSITQDGITQSINIGISRDTTDVKEFPTEGTRFSLSVEPGYSKLSAVSGIAHMTEFGPKIGEPFNYCQFRFEGSAYFSRKLDVTKEPLDTLKPVFALKVGGGRNFGEVPFSKQFFVGGTHSLRGYPSHRFWGNNMYVASAEYRYPVMNNLYLFGFTDSGYAWGGYPGTDQYDQNQKSKFTFGYGLGAALRTPMGTVSVSLGFDKEGNWDYYPSLGFGF